MNITVKKGTVKSNLFLGYSYIQTDKDVKNSIQTTSDAPIHDDLRNAFRDLIPHFAIITEEISDENLVEQAIENPDEYLVRPEEGDENDSLFLKYNVHEFSVSGSEGSEMVVLSGTKQLLTFESVSFSTPKIELDSAKYKFSGCLQATIEKLRSEVFEYMQGKQAPKKQLEMFAGMEEDQEQFA